MAYNVDPSFKLEGTPYEVQQIIGIGAYGQVRQAVDMVNIPLPCVNHILVFNSRK